MGGQERLEIVGGAHLTEVERRKVDRLVLNLQVLIRYHLVKCGLDSGLLGFQQFYTGIHELITVGIDVTYDCPQLHNDITKVQSFGENIAEGTKKASTIRLYADDTSQT